MNYVKRSNSSNIRHFFFLEEHNYNYFIVVNSELFVWTVNHPLYIYKGLNSLFFKTKGDIYLIMCCSPYFFHLKS